MPYYLTKEDLQTDAALGARRRFDAATAPLVQRALAPLTLEAARRRFDEAIQPLLNQVDAAFRGELLETARARFTAATAPAMQEVQDAFGREIAQVQRRAAEAVEPIGAGLAALPAAVGARAQEITAAAAGLPAAAGEQLAAARARFDAATAPVLQQVQDAFQAQIAAARAEEGEAELQLPEAPGLLPDEKEAAEQREAVRQGFTSEPLPPDLGLLPQPSPPGALPSLPSLTAPLTPEQMAATERAFAKPAPTVEGPRFTGKELMPLARAAPPPVQTPGAERGVFGLLEEAAQIGPIGAGSGRQAAVDRAQRSARGDLQLYDEHDETYDVCDERSRYFSPVLCQNKAALIRLGSYIRGPRGELIPVLTPPGDISLPTRPPSMAEELAEEPLVIARGVSEEVGERMRAQALRAGREAVEDIAEEVMPSLAHQIGTRVRALPGRAAEALARATPEEAYRLGAVWSGRTSRAAMQPVWADELEAVGGQIDPDGTVLLYHATTKEAAREIERTGVLRSPADAPDAYGVYFGSHPSVSESYGDGTVIPVRVRAADIVPDDVFPGRRLDFVAPTRRGIYRPVAVGEAALRPPAATVAEAAAEPPGVAELRAYYIQRRLPLPEPHEWLLQATDEVRGRLAEDLRGQLIRTLSATDEQGAAAIERMERAAAARPSGHGLAYPGGDPAAAVRLAQLEQVVQTHLRTLPQGGILPEDRAVEVTGELLHLRDYFREASRGAGRAPYPVPVRGGAAGADLAAAAEEATAPVTIGRLTGRPEGIRAGAPTLTEAARVRTGLARLTDQEFAEALRTGDRTPQWLVDRADLTPEEADLVFRHLGLEMPGAAAVPVPPAVGDDTSRALRRAAEDPLLPEGTRESYRREAARREAAQVAGVREEGAPARDTGAAAALREVYHANPEGARVTPDAHGGHAADILGRGFYVTPNRGYAEQYGTPVTYQVRGPFATLDQWKTVLAQQRGTMAKRTEAAQALLRAEGYRGIDAGQVINVFDEAGIVAAPPASAIEPFGLRQELGRVFESTPTEEAAARLSGAAGGAAGALAETEEERAAGGPSPLTRAGRGLGAAAVGALAGRAAVRAGGQAARVVAAGERIVPPEVARTLGEVRLPAKGTPAREALELIARDDPGVRLAAEGLQIDLISHAHPAEASGLPALRGGVFYFQGPLAGNAYRSNFDVRGSLGGTSGAEGATLFQRPLVVLHAGDDNRPLAYHLLETLVGRAETARLDRALEEVLYGPMESRPGGGSVLTGLGLVLEAEGVPRATAQAIVDAYGPSFHARMAGLEQIAAERARAAGYDAIVGVQRYGTGPGWLSELFDLREATIPGPGGAFTLRPEFTGPVPEGALGIVAGGGRQGTPGGRPLLGGQRLAAIRGREAQRLTERAEQLRDTLETRYARWEELQQRVTELEAQAELAGSVSGIVRPAWARARGALRAFTDEELVELARRAGETGAQGAERTINVFEENWGDLIDPADIAQWRRERLSRATGATAAGITSGERQQAGVAARKAAREAAGELAALDKDIERQLGYVGGLEARADKLLDDARAAAAAGQGVPDVDAALFEVRQRLQGLIAARPTRRPRPEVLAEGLPPGATPIEATPAAEVAKLRLDQFPDWARDTIREAAEQADFARTQRRGVLSDAAAEQLADDLERTVETWVRQGKAGRAYSTEETRALANAVTAQAEKVNTLTRELADAEVAGLTTDLLLARTHAEGERLQALVTLREGARAEWGRAGRAWQAAARVSEAPTEAISRIYQKLGGRDNALKALTDYQKLLDGGATPVQMAEFWAKVERPPPGAEDWFRALRYNSMLSGPRTLEVNVVGNLAEVPWRLLRDTAASAGRGRPEELIPELSGLWIGTQRGAQAFLEVLAHGITAEAAARGDLPRDIASRVRNPFVKGAALTLESVSRVMSGLDEFARAQAYSMMLGREAAVAASDQGLRGAAWQAEVARLLAAPPEPMQTAALGAADRMTYQGDMGATGRALEQVQWVPILGNILFPFLRTVYHLTARGIDRSPLGFIGTLVDVKRGVYGKTRGELGAALRGRGEELRKGVVPLGERVGDNVIGGGLAYLWFQHQAFQGNITGAGPKNRDERDLLRETGWQPYSLKLGDSWVSYANWGPIAVPLAGAAAIAEGQRYKEPDATTAAVVGDTLRRFGELFTEQAYLSGVGAVYKAIQDPERYGEQWLTQFLQTLVPFGSAINTAGQVLDPFVRRPAAGDLGQKLAARFPVLREGLEPAIGATTGEPVRAPQAGAAALQPLRISPARENRVASEAARLEQAGFSVPVRQFGPREQYAGEAQTPAQRRLLQETFGRATALYVGTWLERLAYQALPDAQKAATLTAALAVAARVADLQVGDRVARSPQEQADLAWAQTRQYAGVTGTPTAIGLQNLEIALAKAKLKAYRKQYGEDRGEFRLYQEDKRASRLAQRDRLDADYLRRKRAVIEQRFGVDVERAAEAPLAGAGQTLLLEGALPAAPAGGGRR